MMRRFPFLTILILLAGWIAAEISVFNLVAGWTGNALAFLLFILKSVAGFVFVGRLMRNKLMSMGNIKVVALDPTMLSSASLKIVGAILLVVPGFMAGVIGLALLTPSIRDLFASKTGGKSGSNAENPRDFDLQSGDWQEIPPEVPPETVKRIRRKKHPRDTTQP
jgi:UPF0716 family protein affecting phage T7 exclusion